MSKRTTTSADSNRSKKPRISTPSPHGPFWNGTTTDPEIIAVLVNNRDEAFHYDAETSRLDLVQEVWEFKIVPFFNVKELAMLRPTSRWCNEQWQEFLKRNIFRVPEQVPTIDEAMTVGFNLAKQKEYSKEYLKEKPLVVVLSEGVHVVNGSWTDSYSTVRENTLGITCSNITFIGQGKDKTTVHGGIGVSNKKNILLKSLTLTNLNGFGLLVSGEEASVEMMDVSAKECGRTGLVVSSGASVKATQCEVSENGDIGVVVNRGSKGIFTDSTFHHNAQGGVWAAMEAAREGTLVELRGEQTEIHHNNQSGLFANSNAIINIYIPSQPITALVHDNEERDLFTYSSGKIQSQLSSSSLELTVIHRGGNPVAH